MARTRGALDTGTEHAETRGERSRRRLRSGAIGGVLGNALWVIVANAYALWVPWCDGVVTSQWPRVLWALNLGGILAIGGNAMRAWDRRWAGELGYAISAAGALLASIAVYTIYPFDFARIASWIDPVARVLMVLGIAVNAIALVVRTLRAAWARDRA